MDYPNKYYEELAGNIIKSPSIRLKEGEVCFYEGLAQSFVHSSKEVSGKPKTKTSFFITPWFGGIKRTKQSEIKQVIDTKYYNGKLYITNMRVVFECKVDNFDLRIDNDVKVTQYSNGIQVSAKNKIYNVMTNDVEKILHIFELMNKAFLSSTTSIDEKEAPTNQPTTKELPFGWVTNNASFIQPRDKKIYDLLSVAKSGKSVSQRVQAYKDLINYFLFYKDECRQKGELFELYFDQMWMHKDSKKYDFIKEWQNELTEIEDSYLDIKETEDAIEKAKPTIKEDLFLIIKDNPGILQKDIYLKFEPAIKQLVLDTLYELVCEGKIKKEKFGNSNKLYAV